jgi:hypothetical protein
MSGARHRPEPETAPDTIDFQVIGELRDNPNQLLLLGDDGQCYCFDVRRDRITPLDPDDSWAVDTTSQGPLRLELPLDVLAG